MIDGKIRIHLGEIVKCLGALAEEAEPAVALSVRISLEALIADVLKNRMTGQYLGVVTGTARRGVAGLVGPGRGLPGAGAIRAIADQGTEISGTMIRGMFGSPHRYVRAHEEGADEVVMVREHTRRPSNRLRKLRENKLRRGLGAQASLLPSSARESATGGLISVKAHAAHIRIRAKHFFRDTIQLGADKIGIRARRALYLLALNGRLPRADELMGVR